MRQGKIAGAAAVAVGLMAPAFASAALSIGLGSTTISAAANQHVNLVVTAASAPDMTPGIEGLDIYAQVENGGTDNGAATNPTAPVITNLDLTTGIFAGANNSGGNSGLFITPDGFLVFDSISTPSVSSVPQKLPVGVGSVLGTLTLDATGLPAGTYHLYFENVGAGSGFGQSSSDFTNSSGGQTAFNGPDFTVPASAATLTIVSVPEPTALLPILGIASVVLLRRRPRATR